MEQRRFVLPDMVCDGCAGAVKRAVGQVAGVLNTEVNVPTNTIVVSYVSDMNPQLITEALDRAGFPAGE